MVLVIALAHSGLPETFAAVASCAAAAVSKIVGAEQESNLLKVVVLDRKPKRDAVAAAAASSEVAEVGWRVVSSQRIWKQNYSL